MHSIEFEDGTSELDRETRLDGFRIEDTGVDRRLHDTRSTSGQLASIRSNAVSTTRAVEALAKRGIHCQGQSTVQTTVPDSPIEREAAGISRYVMRMGHSTVNGSAGRTTVQRTATVQRNKAVQHNSTDRAQPMDDEPSSDRSDGSDSRVTQMSETTSTDRTDQPSLFNSESQSHASGRRFGSSAKWLRSSAQLTRPPGQGITLPDEFVNTVRRTGGKRSALPDSVREPFERATGVSTAGVTYRDGATAAALNEQLGSRAFYDAETATIFYGRRSGPMDRETTYHELGHHAQGLAGCIAPMFDGLSYLNEYLREQLPIWWEKLKSMGFSFKASAIFHNNGINPMDVAIICPEQAWNNPELTVALVRAGVRLNEIGQLPQLIWDNPNLALQYISAEGLVDNLEDYIIFGRPIGSLLLRLDRYMTRTLYERGFPYWWIQSRGRYLLQNDRNYVDSTGTYQNDAANLVLSTIPNWERISRSE